MAEHFRDFRDPVIDAAAEQFLDPDHNIKNWFYLKTCRSALKACGVERLGSDFEAEYWQADTAAGRAVIAFHDPDIAIPALVRGRDLGSFYTYTADDEPLWTPDIRRTDIAADVATGNPEADGLVMVCEALYKATATPRRISYAAAKLMAPLRDARAIRQWEASTDRTRSEISAHYDLSQEVYTGQFGFLDDEYVQYSSGLLPPGHSFESLDDLQEHKVASLARKLELETAETLLEIGSGWGGLAVALAKRAPNLHITSLTVSGEQLKRAQRRAEEAGVADRIDFRLQDYRDLEVDEPFDRIVSIEMIEAVDWRDLDTYLDALAQLIDPEQGAVVIQSINIDPTAYAKQKHNKSFANVAIFPGGVLTPKEELNKRMAERGMPIYEETSLGASYALTLREWLRNLQENKDALTHKWLGDDIPQDKIDRFYRGFSFYLAACQAGFRKETSNIEGWQLTYCPVA